MKILPVNSISNRAYFKSTVTKQGAFSNPNIDEKKKKKIVPALIALACAGLCIAYLNRKLDTVQLEEPILQILDGQRDILAVQKYKQFIAQKKLNSLKNKLVNCEIQINTPKVYEHIKNNQMKLLETINASI